jgi:hypothetical protein
MLYGKSPFLHENPNLMYGKIIEAEPQFPKEFKYSDEAIDLIKKLLKKNGAERVGYDDEQEIFTHPWFNDIDFAKLIAKKLPALVIPCVEDVTAPTRKSLSQRPTEDGSEEQEVENELELSFEMEGTPSKQKIAGVNDSIDDFSYFEEEGWVETAVDAFDENILQEFEDERNIQMLTNIEEYSEASANEEEGGIKKEKRDALNSPQGELLHTTSQESGDEKDKVRRKGSIDSQFGEKLKNTPKEPEKSERKATDPSFNHVLKKADSSDKVSESSKKGSPASGPTKTDQLFNTETATIPPSPGLNGAS